MAVIVTLVTGCGGGGSYPPTRGYSTEQVTRTFKAHGLVVVRHVPPLENRPDVVLVNVLVTVFVVDRAGSRALKNTRAAMADLRRI